MPVPTSGATPLFSAGDLSEWLGQTVTDARAAAVEQVVWGWLSGPLGLTVRPDPVPANVFSWAIELGGIAHENPAGLSDYQLGAERTGYSSERRAEILIQAAEGGGATSSLRPRGSFPTAQPYPDPVCW